MLYLVEMKYSPLMLQTKFLIFDFYAHIRAEVILVIYEDVKVYMNNGNDIFGVNLADHIFHSRHLRLYRNIK